MFDTEISPVIACLITSACPDVIFLPLSVHLNMGEHLYRDTSCPLDFLQLSLRAALKGCLLGIGESNDMLDLKKSVQ